MSILTDTAPSRIWLCISDEPDDYNTSYPELYAEDAEITWSTDQPVAVTVEYVRVDLSEIAKLRAECDALKAQLATTQNAESMQRMDCRNLTEKVIPNLREQRDALAAENLTLRNAAVNASEQHDALAALLRELDETWIRSTCPQSIRDRIDAALAGKDAP